jgi:hypothetical protein
VVRRVGIQLSLDRVGGEGQCLATRGDFQRFEIEALARIRPYEFLDLVRDLRRERCLEPPFSAASFETAREICVRASQSFSLTSMNCCTKARNRRYSSICSRVCCTEAPPGIPRVTVFPATARVRIHVGPWPGESLRAQ